MLPDYKNRLGLRAREEWRIVRKISLGMIIAIVLQTVTAVWWAAKLDMRVKVQAQWIQQNTHLSELVFR